MVIPEDEQYDMWRDDCYQHLHDKLEKFVESVIPPGKRDYYANRPDRIWKSIASIAQNKITFNTDFNDTKEE